MEPTVISHIDAKEQGLLRFFTGVPCSKGHTSERITNSNQCVQCRDDYHRARRATPAEKAARAAYARSDSGKQKGVLSSKKNRDTPQGKETRKKYANTPKVKQYMRQYARMANYNLSAEAYDVMIQEQQNKCAICSVDFLVDSVDTTPCVDHCHTSGTIRGLLCRACNWMLGNAKDDPRTLINAIDYLSRAKGL